MRIGFVTCVRLGLSCIEEICAIGGSLQLVVTLRDDLAPSKAGRVSLDELCARHGFPLVKVANINDAGALSAIRGAQLDWLFIVGWSQIARQEVLKAPRLGCLGMHPTLLPEGRGRAAIPWAILKGLRQTGVSLIKLDLGVDTGPVIAQAVVPIQPSENATTLYEKIVAAHRALIAQEWKAISIGDVRAVAQDERLATVWPERKPSDGALRQCASVDEAHRLVRAVTRPYPGAFMDAPQGRLRVWAASPRTGQLIDGLTCDAHGIWLIPFPDGALEVIDGEWEAVE